MGLGVYLVGYGCVTERNGLPSKKETNQVPAIFQVFQGKNPVSQKEF
jgi:hypothetical protein